MLLRSSSYATVQHCVTDMIHSPQIQCTVTDKVAVVGGWNNKWQSCSVVIWGHLSSIFTCFPLPLKERFILCMGVVQPLGLIAVVAAGALLSTESRRVKVTFVYKQGRSLLFSRAQSCFSWGGGRIYPCQFIFSVFCVCLNYRVLIAQAWEIKTGGSQIQSLPW